MFERRLLAQLDWRIILVTFLLAATGVTMIYSATYSKSGGLEGLYIRQLYWFGIGLLLNIRMRRFSF